MLFLQLVLLVVLLPGGDREDVYLSFPTYFQEPISFQIILTTSFYSRSWTQNVGSAWLDELQTYGWDSDSGTFTCMWPWSRGNFSNKELMEEQRSFHTFSIRFPLIFQDHFSEWQLECEFSSLQGEMEEAGYMSFVSCLLEGKSLHCLLNLISLHFETELQTHISDSCPPFLLGLLDAGKTHLQRQEQPPSVGLVFLAVIVLLVFLAGLAWWLWKRCESLGKKSSLFLELESFAFLP
uniref:MHC class I-like antigen recognition-like domain-containing protein n=1 Tax=Canis lupus dingo TaxID=286419 RepID=A0A8C0R409_CANLU